MVGEGRRGRSQAVWAARQVLNRGEEWGGGPKLPRLTRRA